MSIKRLHTLSSAVKLSYTVFKPPAPARLSAHCPLLIMHGLFGSKRNWESIAKALSRTGLEIITIDARNHGDSPHVDSMDYHSMSADVVQLLADLHLIRVNVLGHSMGGKVAMALALTQPDLVENLIVEDIAPSVSVSTGIPEAVDAMRGVSFNDPSLTTLHSAKQLANKQLLKYFPDKPTREFILTNIKRKTDGHFGWRINLDAIGRGLQNIIGFPLFAQPFTGNTLFLGGSNSKQIRQSIYSEIFRLFPSARIQHIEGAGHWVHADKPYHVMAAIESFLKTPSSKL